MQQIKEVIVSKKPKEEVKKELSGKIEITAPPVDSDYPPKRPLSPYIFYSQEVSLINTKLYSKEKY